MTGESIPVYKTINDNVISGTINQNGHLKVKALKVLGDTTLSQIINLVEEASNSKAPISKLADKVSAVFVPTVILISILAFIFWITIAGANVPSNLLMELFYNIGEKLGAFLNWCAVPDWFYGIVKDGIFLTVSWVVAVMLPPMAIFFPLFTLLEDFGLLPRIAFHMDGLFQKANAHGKQALTMCMGFGCNSAGVTACRIIDSPRERLIAILTNNFVPCNGRLPQPLSEKQYK